MFSAPEVSRIAAELAAARGGTVSETAAAFVVVLANEWREVRVEWPKHDLAEVWLTFVQGGKEIFQNWVECLERDDKAEFASYVGAVAGLFLDHECRVARRGFVFRHQVLEYRSNGVWRNVLEGGA